MVDTFLKIFEISEISATLSSSLAFSGKQEYEVEIANFVSW